jgi:Mg-chelatase subunit ChlD
MPGLMRCDYCGLLQDEPAGVKSCARCGGELHFENVQVQGATGYLGIQLELDQVAAPAGQNVERHLLATITAPKEVPAGELPKSTGSRPEINFCAVLDNSGSMQGEKLDQALQAVRMAGRTLHPGDVFSLVTFNSEVHCVLEPTVAGKDSSRQIDAALQKIQAGGMTALDGGLEMGIRKCLEMKKENNLVLLLSDGQTNVGETDLEVIGSHAMQARHQGLLVSALGIGLDYNEALLTEVATQGGGRFYHVEHAGQIPAFLAGELGEVAMLAAREVRLRLVIPPGATLMPLSAAFPIEQADGEAVLLAGDIPCETELEIPLRLALVGGAAGSRLSIIGRMTYRSPAGNELETPVNRVTVRFLEKAKFALREGVVVPVVERVLARMSAASLLGISRTMALKPDQAEKASQTTLEALQAYASLLGEERAKQEVGAIREQFINFYSSPAAAKQAVSFAHASVRGSKDFRRKP